MTIDPDAVADFKARHGLSGDWDAVRSNLRSAMYALDHAMVCADHEDRQGFAWFWGQGAESLKAMHDAACAVVREPGRDGA